MSKPGENIKHDCQYNEGCACTNVERASCARCGWNPKVIERRNKEIRSKTKEAQNEGV